MMIEVIIQAMLQAKADSTLATNMNKQEAEICTNNEILNSPGCEKLLSGVKPSIFGKKIYIK
jgi:hypothetical protein